MILMIGNILVSMQSSGKIYPRYFDKVRNTSQEIHTECGYCLGCVVLLPISFMIVLSEPGAIANYAIEAITKVMGKHTTAFSE